MEKNKDFSKVYSFSRLDKFEKCPMDYYFYYLDPEWKGYKKPKDYNTKGSAVHGAITLFYHLSPPERTFKNLKDLLYEAWFSETDLKRTPPLGELGGFNSLSHERKIYFDTLKALKNFFNLKDIEPPLFYLPTKDIKHSFSDYESMVQPIHEEFSISGKFDRIDKLSDGTLRIIDFKTSRNHQDRFQLDFYRILAELNFKLPVSKVSFYYLTEGQIVDFPVFNNDHQDFKDKILERAMIIKNTQEFTPKTSNLCKYCDFKEICPIFSKT